MMYWQISWTIMSFGDQGGGERNGSKICVPWLWLITTYALASRWQIEMVPSRVWTSPKMSKNFTVNVVILPQPKHLRQYQWSNMDMTELPLYVFCWFQRNKDDMTIVAQHVRDLFTTATEQPTQRRDRNASAIWNREFSNMNLEVFFFKMYGIPYRQLRNDAWKCPKVTQDGMLNISNWYKPRLTFTAVRL